MFAVSSRNINLINKLVHNGAKLNAQSRTTKMTPLLVATENTDTQTISLLLSLGADVNGTNHEGYTPLMAAVETGQLPIVEYFLKQGAKADLQDASKQTALSLAEQHGHAQITQLIQKKGLLMN